MTRIPSWLVVELPGGELAVEVLGSTLLDLGAKGMTPENDRLLAAFRSDVDASLLMDQLRLTVHLMHKEGLLPDEHLQARIVEDEDWVGRWRRSLGPIRAGERFVIVPPGVDGETKRGEIVLAIEPRMAFGTGEHATTRLALAGLEKVPVKGGRVLDLGCGNGVLTLGAAFLGAESVLAVDFEEESVVETGENAEGHGVADRVTVMQADVLDWAPPEPPYDLLVANIYLTPILVGLLRWRQWIKPNGHAIFTGVKAGDEEAELRDALKRAKLKPVHTEALDTWFCAVCEAHGA